MRILLIGGKLPATRWSSSGVLQMLCHGLASRGHDVSLACISADDAGYFAPARVLSFQPYDQSGSDWPGRFAAWARRVIVAHRADVVISTTRMVWGDVWMPLGPSAAAWLAQVHSALGPVGVGKWLYKHTGVLAARSVELRRPWPRGPGGRRPARIAVFGVEASGWARDALASHRLDTRVVALPFVSTCEPLFDVERERSRLALRNAIGLDSKDTFALASCVGLVGRSLTPIYEAAAAVNSKLGRTGRQGKLVVGVLARDAYHAHDAAVRAGAAEWVRVLGTTARVEATLSAADIAIVPPASAPDRFAAGSAGRFAADALRLARPVLAADGAPGAELIASLPGLGEPGAVVRNDGVEPPAATWERVLARALEQQWRERALVAAAAAGKPERIGENRFLDALEEVMSVARTEQRRSAVARV